MNVLYQINYLTGLGADRWISSGYRDAFEDMGHTFSFLTFADDLGARIAETKADLLIIGVSRVGGKHAAALERARANGTKVFVWTDSMVKEDAALMDAILHHDIADLYFGETEADWMKEFMDATGRRYVTVANAANKKLHFPAPPSPKYACDVAYLGANLPLKKTAFERLLFPLRKKYRVRVYGPGWTLTDDVLRALAGAARKLRLMGVNDLLSKMRITVPVAEENLLYSSAKISLNIHEAREGRTAHHVILNERTFKIPACGGLEICDYNPALRRYFAEDEMLMGENDADWHAKIDYCLRHEAERKAMREKGTARAFRDHTYHNRAAQLIALYKETGGAKA